MIAAVKVYGERNSGTKYLARLIKRNLHVTLLRGVAPPGEVRKLAEEQGISREDARNLYFQLTFPENLGWKHALVKPASSLQSYPIYDSGLVFVTISKNPYSWLRSLYRRPYHQARHKSLSFETFLTRPWPTVGRENAPSVFSSPVAIWNQKNRSYSQLGQAARALNLTYEVLVAAPQQIVQRISDFSGASWKRGTFTNIDRLPGRETRSYDYYRHYYLKEEWRAQLSDQAIALINERLDEEVLGYFGYQKLQVGSDSLAQI